MLGRKRRAVFLRLVVVLLLMLLTGRLAWVQVVKADEIREKVEEMRLVKHPLAPVRGAILDRNGRVLALSVITYSVVADTRQMTKPGDLERVATGLQEALRLDREPILQRLRDNPDRGYVPLIKDLDLEQWEAVKALRLPGIYPEQQAHRIYPQGPTTNQIIGFMVDGKGEDGIEASYDAELAGKPGYIIAELTEGNTPIEGTIKAEVPADPGLTLVLSLDLALQQVVEAKLDQLVKELDAKRASVLAMDIYTGEILVMAMRPGADPGDRSTWGDPVEWARINNWALEPMSPGSMFKTIVTAAALEERAITLGTTFLDSGRLPIGGCIITNWDMYVPPTPEPLNIAQLLQRSSNVGLVQVGERLGHDNFIKYMKGFGFMEPTGVDLPYEGVANGLSAFDQKYDCDWANMYIGQHLEVTPIQMLTAVSAIANGGKLVQPHLVRELRNPDGQVVKVTPTTERRQVVSAETAKETRDLMVSVIQEGTASRAKPQGYTVGGKTGTAQKFDERGVMKERYLADFIGFAPANNPQVVMLVMVDEPVGDGFGGMIAAPAFAELLPHVMRAIGIAPESDAALGEEKAPPKATHGVVPDVQWLPLAWAKDRLAEAGFVVKTTGAGELVGSQSLAPGSSTTEGAVVELGLVPKPQPSEAVRLPDFRGLSLAEASRLATEVGLTLKASGSGFVADQVPGVGALVPGRSVVSVRLAPR